MISEADLKSHFLIIDGHALIYRAFHAFPPLTNAKGELINALYGFLRILLSVLKQVQPDYWLVAFDHPAPTKRKLAFDFYKANRKPMPDELRPQITKIEEAVHKLGIPEMKVAGIEADDIIGTISREVCKQSDVQVLILTGDKDSFQLVNDCIHVLVPNMGRRKEKNDKSMMLEYNPALVKQKMQIPPEKIIDYKALAGDPSDNIAGVPGIGAKTAINLIDKFGSLDEIYQAIDQENTADLRASVVSKLINGRESAYISRQLATIDQNVTDLDFQLDACRVNGYDKNEVVQFLNEYGFNSLIKLLPEDDFDKGLQEALF